MRAVSAIVMAAGNSSRMGGPNKLLLPWGQGTIIGSTVKSLGLCLEDIVVVTGRDADLVGCAVAPFRTVFNEEFSQGLGTSIAAGVAACPHAEGFLIVLGDMPGLAPSVVLALLQTFATAALDAIIAPVYESEPNRTGHPVLFGADHRGALLTLTGDEGARAVIKAHPQKLALINVPGSLGDIDQPGDLPNL